MSKSRTKVLAVLLALAAAMMLSALFCLWQPIQARADTQETALQEEITAAESGATIKLTGNVTESITIPEDKKITLDLGGYTLTNDGDHTIINYGVLTIVDSVGTGVVDNVTHEHGALVNYGMATLLGGNFTRSRENGQNAEDAGGNSWYVIKNYGHLTIGNEGEACGVSVTQSGHFSSMIANGYYNSGDYTNNIDLVKTADKVPTITINGGTFDGGLNTVKNDDYAKMTINGGAFKNVSQAVVFNVNELTITGGTFDMVEGAEAAIITTFWDAEIDKGTTTITGGTFNGAIIEGVGKGEATYTVSGGTYATALPESYIADDSLFYPTEEGYKVIEGTEIPTDSVGVAAVDNAVYKTLQEAIYYASDGATIKLVKDTNENCEVKALDKEIAINLNGYTLTAANSESYALYIQSSKNIALMNGKVNGEVVLNGSQAIDIAVEDIDIVTNNSRGMQIAGVGGERVNASLNNVTVNTTYDISTEIGKGIYLYKADSELNNVEIVLDHPIEKGGVQSRALEIDTSNVSATNLSISATYYGIVFWGPSQTASADESTYDSLVLKNSTVEASAPAITGNGTWHGTIIELEGCVLTSEEVAIYHPQYGKLYVRGNDNVITGITGIEMRAGELVVEGGTITATGDPFEADPNGNGSTTVGAAVAVSQHTTNLDLSATISGGTLIGVRALYEADLQDDKVDNISLSVTGGQFNGEVLSENVAGFISGGTYATALPESYIADESLFYPTADGYAVGVYDNVVEEVKNSEDVAVLYGNKAYADIDEAVEEGVFFLIGKDGYQTLADAAKVAEDGATIKLLSDATLEAQLKFEEDKALTLDLGDNTLKIGAGMGNVCALDVRSGSLTIVAGENGAINAADAGDLTVPVGAMASGALVTIEGGTITVKTNKESCVYAGGGGKVVINGGSFINLCEDPFEYDKTSPSLAVNVSDSGSGVQMEISGGTFVGRNPILGDTNANITESYLAEDVKVALAADGSFIAFTGEAPAGVEAVYSEGDDGLIADAYTATAFAAAIESGDYQTVRLGAQITLNSHISVTSDVVIDLGGFTVNSKGAAFVKVFSGTTTVKNGTVLADKDAFYVLPQNAVNVAKLVLEETLTAESRTGCAVFIEPKIAVQDPIAILVTSAVLKSWNDGAETSQECSATIQGNGMKHGTSITINGGEVYNSKDVAIYHPQYGTLIVNGGSVYGGRTGIEMRAGELVVTGGKIEGAGDPFEADPNGNGSTTVGAAVAVSQHTSNQALSATISGGTLIGERALYEADLQDDKVDNIALSVTGGTFNGEVFSENVEKFITGGTFSENPNAAYFADGLEGAFYNGMYYVVAATSTDTEALLNARLAAQTDIRTYAASCGLRWNDVKAYAQGETFKYAAEAVLAAYDEVAAAESEGKVLLAKLAAFDAVDALLDQIAGDLASYKKEAIEAIETEIGDTGIVLPTSTYAAILNAASKAEVDAYKANALAEIEDIAAARAEIAAQTEQLEKLETLFNGAIADIGDEFVAVTDQIEAAITAAQNAINANTSEELDAAVETLTAAITAAQNAINAKIDAMQADIDSLETDVDSLSGALEDVNADLKADIAAAVEKVEEVKAALGSLATAEDAEALAADIADLQAAVDAIATEVTAIKTAQTEIGNKIDAMQRKIDSLITDVGALEDVNADLKADIAAAVEKVEEVKAALGSLATAEDAAALAADIADLQAAVDAIGEKVTAATNVETAKTDAKAEIDSWLEAYVESVTEAKALRTAALSRDSVSDKLENAFGKENAKIILRYYDEAVASIDSATSVEQVAVAVATFKAQVASIEAANGNSTDLTVVYILLAVALVLLVAAVVLLALRMRRGEAVSNTHLTLPTILRV